jgi:DNA mismatch repair protein MutS
MSKLTTEYLHLKKSIPDSLLLYRLGGFYEFYFDDAIIASKCLNIALNHKKIAQQKIPTCGFPIQSMSIFANKLLALGFKIAVAEQFIIDNKITRQIAKILTPGTIIDDEFLNIEDNILCSIAKKNQNLLLCFGNILMGEFYLDEIAASQINQYLQMIDPTEILVADDIEIDQKFSEKITIFSPNSYFKINNHILETLAKHNHLALRNMFEYIATIHGLEILKNFKIKPFKSEKYLKVDPLTIANLQLKEVIKTIDNTSSVMGKRFLSSAIKKPLAEAKKINDRLDGVEFLIAQNELLKTLQKHLGNLPDLEKIIGRLAVVKNVNIYDLSLILLSLKEVTKISEKLFWCKNKNNLPVVLEKIMQELLVDFELINVLGAAMTTDGGIRLGFNLKLDNYKNSQQEIWQKISNLETKYQLVTTKKNSKNLKIEFNSTIGFYFEIKRKQLDQSSLPKDWQLLQNLNNSVRFSTAELKNYQLELADLEVKIKAIEEEILQQLVKKILVRFKEIKNSCKAISVLDLLVSFAITAQKNNYIKPKITNQNSIKIIAGIHPISDQFVANDFILDSEKIWLITGAHMAGKSTFLRQNAVIVLLAQMGSFVPAISAEIGVRKQIFAKMMVSDDLTKGQSSFMAEMLQMAEILKNADENSLIIIDELCQTTNNFEGEAISLNIIKSLASKQSLALISTHNLNLAAKCSDFANIVCKKITKNHKITNGVANQADAQKIAKEAGINFNN